MEADQRRITRTGGRRAKEAVLVLLLASFSGAEIAAQEVGEDWLPPRVEQPAIQQLAQRIHAVAGEGASPERALQGATILVRGIREVLEARGARGTFEAAPRFEALQLPSAGKPDLDAMAAYQICNLVLMRQAQDPAFRDDQNAQFTSAVGLTAVTLAIFHLRQPFVEQGGDPAEIEAFLTDERFQPVFDQVQSDLATRERVEKTCQPVVWGLVEQPLGSLGSPEP